MMENKPLLGTVLIIDDSPEILQMMRQIIEMEGYRVVTAENGTNGVDAALKEKVSAVLLDLSLPDMSGFEVLKQIKSVKTSLPIIMVTGNHLEEEAQRAIELGAWDYITKPIDFEYLKNVLQVSLPPGS